MNVQYGVQGESRLRPGPPPGPSSSFQGRDPPLYSFDADEGPDHMGAMKQGERRKKKKKKHHEKPLYCLGVHIGDDELVRLTVCVDGAIRAIPDHNGSTKHSTLITFTSDNVFQHLKYGAEIPKSPSGGCPGSHNSVQDEPSPFTFDCGMGRNGIGRLLGRSYSSLSNSEKVDVFPNLAIVGDLDTGRAMLQVRDRFFSPEEIFAALFRHLRSYAETFLKSNRVKQAVVTTSSSRDMFHLQSIKLAGRIAGFREVSVVEEAVSAYTYFYHKQFLAKGTTWESDHDPIRDTSLVDGSEEDVCYLAVFVIASGTVEYTLLRRVMKHGFVEPDSLDSSDTEERSLEEKVDVRLKTVWSSGKFPATDLKTFEEGLRSIVDDMPEADRDISNAVLYYDALFSERQTLPPVKKKEEDGKEKERVDPISGMNRIIMNAFPKIRLLNFENVSGADATAAGAALQGQVMVIGPFWGIDDWADATPNEIVATLYRPSTEPSAEEEEEQQAAFVEKGTSFPLHACFPFQSISNYRMNYQNEPMCLRLIERSPGTKMLPAIEKTLLEFTLDITSYDGKKYGDVVMLELEVNRHGTLKAKMCPSNPSQSERILEMAIASSVTRKELELMFERLRECIKDDCKPQRIAKEEPQTPNPNPLTAEEIERIIDVEFLANKSSSDEFNFPSKSHSAEPTAFHRSTSRAFPERVPYGTSSYKTQQQLSCCVPEPGVSSTTTLGGMPSTNGVPYAHPRRTTHGTTPSTTPARRSSLDMPPCSSFDGMSEDPRSGVAYGKVSSYPYHPSPYGMVSSLPYHLHQHPQPTSPYGMSASSPYGHTNHQSPYLTYGLAAFYNHHASYRMGSPRPGPYGSSPSLQHTFSASHGKGKGKRGGYASSSPQIPNGTTLYRARSSTMAHMHGGSPVINIDDDEKVNLISDVENDGNPPISRGEGRRPHHGEKRGFKKQERKRPREEGVRFNDGSKRGLVAEVDLTGDETGVRGEDIFMQKEIAGRRREITVQGELTAAQKETSVLKKMSMLPGMGPPASTTTTTAKTTTKKVGKGGIAESEEDTKGGIAELESSNRIRYEDGEEDEGQAGDDKRPELHKEMNPKRVRRESTIEDVKSWSERLIQTVVEACSGSRI